MVRRRQSEVEQYAISVVCDRQIKHVLIRQRSDKLYAIGTPKHNEKVETLYTLVHTAVCLFSERELTFTFAICYRPSVCRLSSVCL